MPLSLRLQDSQASMEPRSFKRGNPDSTWPFVTSLTLLQWSHVHSNVETPYAHGRDDRARHASMEPRSFKRGNDKVAQQLLKQIGQLQWSHVHSNVETI